MNREKVITDWYELYKHDIYHFLIYYTGTVDVEDIIQDVFIKAIKHVHKFKHESSPKTWLLSIARNIAIDNIRKKKGSKWVSFIPFDNQLDPPDNNTPEDVLQKKESEKQLFAAIQNLKKSYREVVILRGIKELSIFETATILNWNENKVRITYHRALKALHQQGGMFDEKR